MDWSNELTSEVRHLAETRSQPDVIVAGFMKCATTTLQSWLVEQPEFTRGVKEVNYFSNRKNFEQGHQWYQQRIGDPTHGLTVDASPQYLLPGYSLTSAQRVAEINPHAKIIVLYRDPLARAVSHFRHEVGRGREKTPLEDIGSAMTVGSMYVRASGYASCVRPFVEILGVDRLTFVRSEDLSDSGWRLILELVGLADRPPPAANRNVNEEKPSYGRLMHLLYENGLREPPAWAPDSVRRLGKKILLKSAVPAGPPIEQIRASMPRQSVAWLEKEWQEFRGFLV